ncbi:DNA cytosine methyltransferase [Desulfonatronovibrio hydrogenovorans]|uniref:DNA cytosine methyltransferase n=1 Tax=Desulfonatronovibrio hydrogenovorans TaxID=53245 RepID=UPI00068ACD1C|nr:DNA cytosine methyltransferase [Desulfonatronovibrio hydrogenovorans]
MKNQQPPFLLSVYDYTGNWAKPYVEAGWRVLLWDYKFEGCILESFGRLMSLVEEENNGHIDGLLSAPPCTAFASSGARWWPDKDRHVSGLHPFDSFTEYMIALALMVLVMVEAFKPKFWALENPVGRIEKLVPELRFYRRLIFDPCDYGDPYTKRTVLWGKFNPNLKKNPIKPLHGSLMHRLPPSPDRTTMRSVTPPGFAQAFYRANNLSGRPTVRTTMKSINMLEAV